VILFEHKASTAGKHPSPGIRLPGRVAPEARAGGQLCDPGHLRRDGASGGDVCAYLASEYEADIEIFDLRCLSRWTLPRSPPPLSARVA